MDRVLMGDSKPAIGTDTPLGVSISKALAVHESGRAILAVKQRAATEGLIDDIEKLSIVRRGQSYTCLLYTSPSPRD